jgi:hypothetical protein
MAAVPPPLVLLDCSRFAEPYNALTTSVTHPHQGTSDRPMKLLRLRALLTLVLLTASKRHRQRWKQTVDRVDVELEAIQASQRRIEAMENGGRPKVRVV